MNTDDRKPVQHINAVMRKDADLPERVMLHERDGNIVYVRCVDPCDTDQDPAPVPLFDGDQLCVMVHLSHVSLHMSAAGTHGYMMPLRIVLVRREPGKVVARTLRFSEPDDGSRVHVAPGDSVEVQVTLELDAVDEFESQGNIGYVPVTPVLFTWLAAASQSDTDQRRRYLLAAARRLDLAQSLFQRVEELRQSDPEGAPAVRRAVFEMVGAVELAVVSLSRAVDMSRRAGAELGTTATVPSAISAHFATVTAIRHAYEHIEERALGKVHGNPHRDALTIFAHDSVVRDGVITYGSHRLDLATDVPQIIAATRQFLKTAAGEALPPVTTDITL
ncbi:light-mediated development protein DET1 [Mycolicibacterium hippocampi]|uniref:Uncharacterized protein n=1 Tax=Mycolicibacterium hippocampi TaxID=659824 RepID=A0A850PMW5_9MYCO|nr:light-mediated development protein DET1 [Mycolicibacterium hippocampi]NVN51702.1 hypothetical protein [Mycolicibacterium hippocampi]